MSVPVNNNQRCCVIGLDGVPYSLLTDYLQEGLLPNVQKILSAGFRLHQMDASIPDVSSTSWTSFMTGVNPGEHGIYGFMDLRPGSIPALLSQFGKCAGPHDLGHARADREQQDLHALRKIPDETEQARCGPLS